MSLLNGELRHQLRHHRGGHIAKPPPETLSPPTPPPPPPPFPPQPPPPPPPPFSPPPPPPFALCRIEVDNFGASSHAARSRAGASSASILPSPRARLEEPGVCEMRFGNRLLVTLLRRVHSSGGTVPNIQPARAGIRSSSSRASS